MMSRSAKVMWGLLAISLWPLVLVFVSIFPFLEEKEKKDECSK